MTPLEVARFALQAIATAGDDRSRAMASDALRLIGDGKAEERRREMARKRTEKWRRKRHGDAGGDAGVTEDVTSRCASPNANGDASRVENLSGSLSLLPEIQDFNGSSKTASRSPDGSRHRDGDGVTVTVTPSGDHAALIAHWVATFERVKGAKPEVGAKNGAGAAKLLKGRSLEEAKTIVDRAFEDPFIVDKTPDLAAIAGRANAFVGRPASGTQRRAPAVQPPPANGPRIWKAGDGQ